MHGACRFRFPVPLCDHLHSGSARRYAALALLPATGAHQRFVFGEFAGYADWSRDKARLDKSVELPPWTLRDIRRTFVTNVNELVFAEPHIVEAIVNHISGSKAGVAGRYNHAQCLEQRREALDKWGRYLTGLVGCPLTTRQRNVPDKPEEVSNQLVSGTR